MFTAVEGYWSFLIARVILGSSIHIVFSVFYVLVQVKPSQYASKVSVRVEAFDGSFSFASRQFCRLSQAAMVQLTGRTRDYLLHAVDA